MQDAGQQRGRKNKQIWMSSRKSAKIRDQFEFSGTEFTYVFLRTNILAFHLGDWRPGTRSKAERANRVRFIRLI